MPAVLTAPESSTMTKLQKLAALLIILGPDSAAQLLKQFNEDELEAVSMEMAQLAFVSQDLQRDILEEFAEVAVDASTAVLGGAVYTRNALEKSVGASRASDIIGRIAPAAIPVPAMQHIIDLEPFQLLNLLRKEQPQTIALIVSYLAPEKSSRFLSLLPPETRDNVIERVATMEPSTVDVVEKICQVLNQKMGFKPAQSMTQTGGVKSAANLLNSLDKSIGRTLLMDLERRNPSLGEAIRQKMFTFDDLALVERNDLQKIMREVDTRDLATSLKNASTKLKSTLLSVLSKRAAATIHEEISYLGPLKKHEVEAAQARIIGAARQLESDGQIDLNNLRSNSRHALLV